jgi:hypothetical protein
MSTAPIGHRARLISPQPTVQAGVPRWRRPFDSATGTVTLGVLLTILLLLALRLLNG